MSVVQQVKQAAVKAITSLYQIELREESILVNATKPEFEGDYTIVLFAFVKQIKKSPEQLGNELGEYLVQQNPSLFTSFNVIKGFLNLSISNEYWINFLSTNYDNAQFGIKEKIMRK